MDQDKWYPFETAFLDGCLKGYNPTGFDGTGMGTRRTVVYVNVVDERVDVLGSTGGKGDSHATSGLKAKRFLRFARLPMIL
jgi:hypothetical protein